MSAPQLAYAKIVLDTEGVSLDGVVIDSMKIASGVTIRYGGKTTPSPSITLTIHADEIVVTDAIKDFAHAHGVPIVEIHGDTDEGCGDCPRRGE